MGWFAPLQEPISAMRIAYASDLHMEFGQPFNTEGLSDALAGGNPDVLVLAGDVEVDAVKWAAFLEQVSASFGHKPIIVVMGNHEYYHGVYPDDLERYRRALADLWLPNIHLLERETIVIDGVRFLGATLWTDFAQGTQAMSCAVGMSDFTVICDGDTNKVLCTPRITQDHQDTVAWLDGRFNSDWRGPNVVVTHHAPSFRSSHPRFAGSRITGGFCSDMDSRIGAWKPELWIHGHLHDPVDYRIGKTRILCNPWGYPNERREKRFLCATVSKMLYEWIDYDGEVHRTKEPPNPCETPLNVKHLRADTALQAAALQAAASDHEKS